jgi:CheY-like chemotaxis protein
MRRILVVDDYRHTRLAIGIWLKQRIQGRDRGWRRERSHRVERWHVRSDDRRCLYAEQGGVESIRVFHSHAPTVPLIAISGYAFSGPETDDPVCFRMALSLGATRCLRKPFRPATLLGVIDECLSDAEQGTAARAAIASAPPNVSRERANTG